MLHDSAGNGNTFQAKFGLYCGRGQARNLLTSNSPYDNVREVLAGLSHPIPPLYLMDASKLEIPAAGQPVRINPEYIPGTQ